MDIKRPLISLNMNKIQKYSIRLLPRFTESSVKIEGKKTIFPDKSSFLYMYMEIIENEIYNFKTINPNPVIIDCGSNIGLSIIFFKKKFPNSKIISFEPDPYIYSILEKNMVAHSIESVQLINAAVGEKAGKIRFSSDKSDGGRIDRIDGEKYVDVLSLREFLMDEVDFLKIDIEGEELAVLKDCRDLLKNVRNLFVEYHSFVDKKQELNTLLDILSENGFRYFIQSFPQKIKPFLWIEAHNGMDLLLNIYAYRK